MVCVCFRTTIRDSVLPVLLTMVSPGQYLVHTCCHSVHCRRVTGTWYQYPTICNVPNFTMVKPGWYDYLVPGTVSFMCNCKYEIPGSCSQQREILHQQYMHSTYIIVPLNKHRTNYRTDIDRIENMYRYTYIGTR